MGFALAIATAMDWENLILTFGALSVLFGVSCLWYWITNTSTTPPSRLETRPPLQILYEANGAIEVDIVAVHGLGANVDWSWTYRNGTRCVHWLKDTNMLPGIIPKSRIMVYKYDSKWHADAPKTRLQLCGEELMNKVQDMRTRANDRPIIFIGHSMGGNVILYGLLHADTDPKLQDLLESSIGLLFLGTPFRGTMMSWHAKFISTMLHFAGSDSGLIQQLRYNNIELHDKLHYFVQLIGRLGIHVACFHEELPTCYARRYYLGRLFSAIVVDETSAGIPGVDRHGLVADHIRMNKYSGPEDESFRAVSTVIEKWYRCRLAVIRHPRNRQSNVKHAEFGVPRDMLAPHFSERKDILNRISHHLSDPQSCAYVLYGGGGMGKTQIALKHVDDNPETYSMILWIQANSIEEMDLSFQRFANYLRVNDRREDLTNHLLATLSEVNDANEAKGVKRRVLLIYDNLDKPDVLVRIATTHMPRWKGPIKVLITTRDRNCLNLSTQDSEVEPFEDLAAERLMRKMTHHDNELQSGQGDSLQELCSQLGNLPLALQQVASYMRTYGESPKSLLDKLKAAPEDVLNYKNDLQKYQHNLMTVSNQSFERVQKVNVYASEWFLLCSFLGTTVPWALFENAYKFLQRGLNDMTHNPSRKRIEWLFEKNGKIVPGWKTPTMQIAVRDLQRLSLVMLDVSSGIGSNSTIHTLTQQWARLKLTRKEQEKFMGMAMSLVHICAEELRLTQLALGDDKAIYYSQRWLINHAKTLTEFCTQIWKQDIAEVVPLECIKTLASFCIHSEDYPAARAMLDHAVQRKNEHPWSTIDTQRALAHTLRGQKDLDEDNLDEALRLQLNAVEQLSSPEHQHAAGAIELLHARSELATIRKDMGKIAVAIREQREVVDEFTEISGSDAPDTLHEKSCLASIYNKGRLFEKAREIIEDVLQTYQGIPEAKPETKIVYTKIRAEALYGLKNYREAMALEEVVLKEMTALYGEGSLEAARAMQTLGTTHKALGEYDRALDLYSDALEIYQRTVGSTHKRAEKTRRLAAKTRQLLDAAAGNADQIGGVGQN